MNNNPNPQHRGHDDKRNFVRMDVNCPMEYREAANGDYRPAFAVNLSGNGILFRAAEPFELGQRIEVRISPTGMTLHSFHALVIIQRLERGDGDEVNIAASIARVLD